MHAPGYHAGHPSYIVYLSQGNERLCRGYAADMHHNARRGLRNGEQAKSLRQLAAAGCAVTVSTLDIEVPEQARQLVALTAEAAPLGGVFHLAMYLDDNLVANQAGAAL